MRNKLLLIILLLGCLVIPSCKKTKIDSSHPKYLGKWQGGVENSEFCSTTITFLNDGRALYDVNGPGGGNYCSFSASGKASYTKDKIKIGIYDFKIISDIEPYDSITFFGVRCDMKMTLKKSWLLSSNTVTFYHLKQ